MACVLIVPKNFPEMLCAEAYQTEESIRWTGLPTITATCKPILIQEMAGAEDNRQGGDASTMKP
jgi:hypothetical protein